LELTLYYGLRGGLFPLGRFASMIQVVSSHDLCLVTFVGLLFVWKSEPPCMVTVNYVCTVFSSPHLRSIVFSCHIFSRRKGISFSFEASRATHVRSACTSLFNL
jgi:hypothetical protein